MPALLNGQIKADYINQYNNPVAPEGTCNVSAIAVALNAYGIVGAKGFSLLPEELRSWIEDINKGDRHDAYWLQKAANWKGDAVNVYDDYRETYSLNQINIDLLAGNPVVIHSWLTESGHVVTFLAYDKNSDSYLVHDSNGEYFASGYDLNNYNSADQKGKYNKFSRNLALSIGLSADGWVSPENFPDDANNVKSFSAHVIRRKLSPVT